MLHAESQFKLNFAFFIIEIDFDVTMKGDRYNAMTDFHAIVLLMMVLHGYLITLVNAETFSRFTKRGESSNI